MYTNMLLRKAVAALMKATPLVKMLASVAFPVKQCLSTIEI